MNLSKIVFLVFIYGCSFALKAEVLNIGILSGKKVTSFIFSPQVGTYTIFTENGKDIYEGDIVSYKRNVGNWTGKSLTTIHEIIFTEEINAFVMKDNSSYIKLRKHWGYEYEVIGKIHENAELLNQ